VMVSVASVVHKSSGTGEEMWYQNKLHQCLEQTQGISKVQDMASYHKFKPQLYSSNNRYMKSIIPYFIRISEFIYK
jgi:hypothetical protein